MPLPTYDYTNTLLEDVFEPILDPYYPIYVIDFKVCAHFICNFAEAAIELIEDSEEDLRKIIKAMWAYRLNRGPDMLPLFPFVAVVADDLKGTLPVEFSEASVSGSGYWRHIEAHKLEMAEYKGGRGEKSDFFNLVQEIGYEYVLSPGSSFFYFSKEFFEADDIAGHISRLKRTADKSSPLANRQIILGTVDGDWQGLVSDTHEIIWANTGPWLPRLRSEREVCDYYLRKEGMHITSARGCYDFKVEYGDMGDNLYPGTPLRFFDLYEEDSEWRFTPEDTKILLEVLNSNARSNREDHLQSAKKFLLRKGLFLPEIAKTWDEEKQSFFKKADEARCKKSYPELQGRNRKLCLELIKEEEIFEKCKKLVVEDEELKKQIKQETESLRICRETEDKKCSKELRDKLKGLKEARNAIKEFFLQISTGS